MLTLKIQRNAQNESDAYADKNKEMYTGFVQNSKLVQNHPLKGMCIEQNDRFVQNVRIKRPFLSNTFLDVLFKYTPFNGNNSFYKKIYHKKSCNLISFMLHFDKK
mgnify:CR=1 FL=1